MTKPVILNPKSQKADKRQTTASFDSNVLKFCLRIKAFLQMLKKVFFVEYHKNTQKPCETTNIRCANFQNCPEKLKNCNCIKHRV